MKRLLFAAGAFLFLSACRPVMMDDVETERVVTGYDFSQIFESFWNGMNRNYVYWSMEPSPFWEPVLAALPAADKAFVLDHPAVFWDKVYDQYKPKFEALGVFPSSQLPGFAAAAGQAYIYFYEMTSGLRDGHFRVNFNSSLSAIMPALPSGPPQPLPQINHAQDRYLGKVLTEDPPGASGVFYLSSLTGSGSVAFPGSPSNLKLDGTDYFSTYNFVDKVLKDSRYCGPSLSSYKDASGLTGIGIALPAFKIAAGKIGYTGTGGGDILYLSFNYCWLSDLADGDVFGYDFSGARTVFDEFLDNLDAPDVKGIIVDVRGNTGGNPADIGFLWGRMIDTPLTFAESRSKSGEGRLDYGPWMPVRLIPAPDTEPRKLRNKNVPIVVLANKGTASGAEFITMAVKNMPHGKVVGEQTMGACSHTVDSIRYNGGGFNGGPFWTEISGAVVQYRGMGGVVYEDTGITPDVPVVMDRSDWENFYGITGSIKDKALDTAIEIINPGHGF